MDKRRYKRLPVEFDLNCWKAGDFTVKTHRGRAINASPAGLYFSTADDGLAPGTMVNVELTIPPNPGRLERLGRVSAMGRVVRTERINHDANNTEPSADCYGVAIEFCRTPKLTTLL